MARQERLSGLAVARREARERQRLFAEGHLIRLGEPVEVLAVSPLAQGIRHRGGTTTAVAVTRASGGSPCGGGLTMAGRKWGGQAARKDRRRTRQPREEKGDLVHGSARADGPPPRLKIDHLFDSPAARLHGEHGVELAASKS